MDEYNYVGKVGSADPNYEKDIKRRIGTGIRAAFESVFLKVSSELPQPLKRLTCLL